MSALLYVARHVVPAAFGLLEEVAAELHHAAAGKIDVPGAKAMVLAIGLQESDFEKRRQMGGGPAISFFQGEPGGGFRGLVEDPRTRDIAREVLRRMAYGEADPSDFQHLEDNDILACCAARMLIWTHRDPVPTRSEPEQGWRQYLGLWRPGKPRRAPWDENFAKAWQTVQLL